LSRTSSNETNYKGDEWKCLKYDREFLGNQ
jgi:hypothetical protein